MSFLNKINSVLYSTSTNSITKNPRIVIIGAGLAGLSAAHHLIKHNFKNIVILEASDRYGGRVRTVPFADTFVDLGAMWLPTEILKNSITQRVSSMGMVNTLKPDTDSQFYLFPKASLVDRETIQVASMAFNNIVSNEQLARPNFQSLGFHNAYQYLKTETDKLSDTVFKDRQNSAISIFHSFIRQLSGMIGKDLQQVNAYHLAKAKKQYLSKSYITNGMEFILKEFTATLEDHHLQLGKGVESINWNDSQKRKTWVGCVDGSLYHSDHIICTLPLGSLKRFADYIFHPSLPKNKITTIDNIGFGDSCTVFLAYSESLHSWFPEQTVKPVWHPVDTLNRSDWSKDIIEISRIPDSTKVLKITLGSNSCGELHQVPDDVIVQSVSSVLRRVINDKDLPFPKDILRSSWSSDACFLGGQPFISIRNAEESEIVFLSEPLPKNSLQLLFAGDATIRHGFGTIDGANWSGIREAQRIIDYYNNIQRTN